MVSGLNSAGSRVASATVTHRRCAGSDFFARGLLGCWLESLSTGAEGVCQRRLRRRHQSCGRSGRLRRRRRWRRHTHQPCVVDAFISLAHLIPSTFHRCATAARPPYAVLDHGCACGAAVSQQHTASPHANPQSRHCADFAMALAACAGLPVDVLFVADLRVLNPANAGDPDVRVEDVVRVLAAHPDVPIVFGSLMCVKFKDSNGKFMSERKGGLEFATLQLLGKLLVLLRVTADGSLTRALTRNSRMRAFEFELTRQRTSVHVFAHVQTTPTLRRVGAPGCPRGGLGHGPPHRGQPN